VKGLVYQNFHIVAIARLNEKTGYWLPSVRVSWRNAGEEQQVEFQGPADRFKTQEEAENHALSMGKQWIDNKTPLP